MAPKDRLVRSEVAYEIKGVSFYCYLLVAVMIAALMVSRRPSGWRSCLWLVVVFLLLLAPAAIRCDIGTDYWKVYAPLIDNGLLHQDGTLEQWEPAINAICELIIENDLNTQWFFVVCSGITCLCAILSFPKKGFAWCVPAFFVLGYLPSFNVVRQMTAVSVSMLAFSLYLRKKTGWALLVFCTAVLFHKSIVLCVPFVAFAFLIRNLKPWVQICCCLGLAVLLIVANPVQMALDIVEKVPVVNRYLSYESQDQYMESGVKSGLGLALWCAVELALGVFILLRGRGRFYRLTGVFCLLALLVKIAGAKVYIVDRLSLFAEAILPFALSFAWRLRRSAVDAVILLGVAGLILLAFVYNYGFDFRAPGPNEILPYRTIFD